MVLVGTDAGINTLLIDDNKFNTINSLNCDNDQLDLSNVHAIFKNGKDRLWLGTRGNGLFVQDKENAINISVRNHPGFGHVRAIMGDAQGAVYIGTQGGVFRFEDDKVELGDLKNSQNFSKPFLLSGEEVFSILRDRVGNIWFSTDEGLYIYTKDEVLQKLSNTTVKTILDGKQVYTMYIDSKDRIWFGTLNGTLVFLELNDYDNPYLFSGYIGKSLNYQRIAVEEPYQKYFENYGVFSLVETGDGTILAGTNFGVCEVNMGTKSLRPYTFLSDINASSVLENSYVYGLLYSKAQNSVWASTNNGLFQLNYDENETVNFKVKDGLQSLEYNGNAVYKDQKGKLYFGGAKGLDIYDPRIELSKSDMEPNLVLTNLFVNGKAIEVGQDPKIIDKSLAFTKELTLSAKQNTVGFEFASLHLPYSYNNDYRCKLIGLDDDWIDLGAKRSINYGNLAPGDYKFLLQATNNDGVWSSKTLTLGLSILPPWYATWYMNLIWIMLSLIIIGSFIRILVKNQHKNNALRIKELEQKNLQNLYESKLVFFTNLSHEIRTPLSLIVDPIKNLMANREIYKRKPELFNVLNNNVDRLKRLVDQIMDFRKYEYGKLELKIGHHNISDTLESIVRSFEFHSVQKQISFLINLPPQDIPMYFDEDKVEKMVYNVLSNAFKATPAGGKVKITLKEFEPAKAKKLRKYKVISGDNDLSTFNDHVFIKVTDNGVGIKEDKLEEIFTRFYQDNTINSGTGIGLYMVKQLAELHSGSILVKSKPNKGTSFIILLPKNIDIYKTIINKNETDGVVKIPMADQNLLIDNLSPETERPKSYTVVVVEDNDELRYYLKSILQTEYKVLTANNGFEGLELIKEEMPDLVISDVVMPEMSGTELCKKLKDNFDTSHIPIILLTAKSFDYQKVQGLKSGADVYLTKPFNSEIVLANISNLIKGREKLRLIFQNDKLIEPSKVTVSSVDEMLLVKLKRYIEEHIQDQNLSLEGLANEIGVSRAQLFRKMKALTGLTPNNFIKSVRLKFALQLLEEDKFQISEIAFLCGFKEPSYFSRCFKESYGCTPKEYLKD